MATRSKLNDAAERIGAAFGKADRTAHKVGNAGSVAQQELAELKKQVQALSKQLEKSSKRLARALR